MCAIPFHLVVIEKTAACTVQLQLEGEKTKLFGNICGRVFCVCKCFPPGGDREKTAATGRLRGSLAAASMATWKPKRLLYGQALL